MTNRSTRQSAGNADIDPEFSSSLQPIDCLLLAQAVWELGANSWSAVAKLLTKHPLLHRSKSFFTAQSCLAMYNHLMKEAGLECPEDNDTVHAPSHLQLAQKHYQARVNELRDLIITEETKFRAIVAEIDAIRAGQWDNRIKARLSGNHELISPSELQEGSDIAASPQLEQGNERAQVEQPTTEDTQIPETVLEPIQPSPEPDISVQHEEHEAVAKSLEVSTPNGEEVEGEEPTEEEQTLAEPSTVTDPSVPSQDEKLVTDAANLEPERVIEEECIAETVQPRDQGPPVEAEQAIPEGSHTEQYDTEMQPPEAVEIASENEYTDVADEGTGGELALHDSEVDSEAVETAMGDDDPGKVEQQHAPRNTRASQSRQSTTPSVGTTYSIQTRVSPEVQPMEIDSSDHVPDDDTRTDVKSQHDEIKQEQDGSPMPQDDVSSQHREGKRKASFIETPSEYLRDRKRPRDESEPLDEEEQGTSSTGPSRRRPNRQTEEQLANKRFQNVIGLLHSQISQHRNGTIFHNPIKNSEAPDYHEIVKRPMDLKTIKGRIKDGVISNSLEFQRDIYLMFANAMMYNRPGSDIYAMAEDMMLESEDYIHSFRQTEGLVRGTHGHRG